eukprot:8392440-Heterocapsa_arctica.AAC.1
MASLATTGGGAKRPWGAERPEGRGRAREVLPLHPREASGVYTPAVVHVDGRDAALVVDDRPRSVGLLARVQASDGEDHAPVRATGRH